MVTDRGLEHLVGLQKLKELSLRKSKVTDAGMVLVGQLPELTSLNLDFTSVTDAGARHLESLKKLRETHSISHGHLREEGRERLREAIPGLDIMIED